jgi:predicted translin family RNA/ssDNA-binding protein
MYQRDYILRMIDMLGDLIRAIMGLITGGKLEQAERKLNEAFLTFLRKDASFFQHIPVKDITSTLLNEHNYTNGHLEILAGLLYAEAELKEASGKKADSTIDLEKSLKLYLYTEESNRTYSFDRQEKIRIIRDKLDVRSPEQDDQPEST